MKKAFRYCPRRATPQPCAALLAWATLLVSSACVQPIDRSASASGKTAQAGGSANSANSTSNKAKQTGQKTNAASATGSKTASGGSANKTPSNASANGQANADKKMANQNDGTSTGAQAGQANMSGSAMGAAGQGSGTSGAPQQTTPACMDKASEYACDGSKLYHCTEMGGYDMQRDCQSAGKCQAGVKTGSCGMCEPGTARCSGPVPAVCDDMGTWQQGEPCNSAKLCNEMTGMCDPGKCMAGDYHCNGDDLEVCAPDLTEFQKMRTCDPGLCNADAKRCNECKPGTKTCSGESSLDMCSDDGQHMPQPCASDTPYCKGDACVQCRSAADCKSDNECMDPACTDGKCGSGTPKSLKTACSKAVSGGAGVCDLTGTCVTCVDDSDCHDASKRCNPLNLASPCEARSPLEVTASLLGGYTVTVAPGFNVKVTMPSGSSDLTINFGTTPCAGGCTLPASTDAQTYTFSGPSCNSTVPFIQTQTYSATLKFGDSSSGMNTNATCSRTVMLEAKSK